MHLVVSDLVHTHILSSHVQEEIIIIDDIVHMYSASSFLTTKATEKAFFVERVEGSALLQIWGTDFVGNFGHRNRHRSR